MFDHERSLVQKLQGRPFALLGVDLDSDRETLQKAQKKYKLNWRSWWDEDMAIAQRWNVHGIPALFLLDHRGVVRFEGISLRDPKQLEDRIEQLIKEAESEGKKQAALSRR
jgi:peroxiredoxin